MDSGIISIIVACVFLVAGCAIGPDYQKPALDIPDRFRGEPNPAEDALSLSELGWWKLFHDENLHALIRRGLLENKDLRLAVSRVREARAQFSVTQADQFPQLNGQAQFDRNQISGAQARRFGISGNKLRSGPHTSQWIAVGNLSYEIDLWGKLRRASEAAGAELLAQEWAQHRSVYDSEQRFIICLLDGPKGPHGTMHDGMKQE